MTARHRFSLFAFAALVALGSAACGGCTDDDLAPGQNNDHEEIDAGGDDAAVDPDAGGGPGDDLGNTPDPDMGHAGPIPSGVFLTMDPARETYPVGLRLLPQVETFDAFGDPAEFDVGITVDPPEAATLVEDRYELVAEGVVRFTACTIVDGVEGVPVCGWDEIIVNDGPPTITLTSPTPGEQLEATTSPVIVVEGSVTDTFGEPVAFVNGTEVELSDEGAFRTELTPRFGVNHVEVAATDGTHPATAEKVADVMWAAAYAAPADPPVDFDEALVLRLGQTFVDDRQRVSTQPDGTLLTRDLADVLELVVRHLDLMSQVPDPVLDNPQLFLRVTQVSIGKPLVQLDITDTGLEVFIQVGDLQATTTGTIEIENESLSLDGSINGAMSALIELTVDKESPADPIDVSVRSLAVSIDDLHPNFSAPEVDAIFTLAQSVLRGTVEDLLVDTLQGSVVDELPTLLSDVLLALDEVLADQTIDLDTGLGEPITLTLDGGVEVVDTAWRHHLDATLAMSASTSATGVHADSRGVSLMWSGDSPPALFDAGRIQFGLRFALINSLLHALWDAGLLDADITDVVPVNAERAVLEAKLPPVVRPPTQGEPHDLVIELGQVEIETELAGRVDRYGVSIATGVDLGISNGELAVTIGTAPAVRTWLISSSEAQSILTPDALQTLIERDVWPEFTAALAGGLSIPLPAPDLSGLGSIAAPLANLVLEFRQVLPLVVRHGWVIIDATLEGMLSPTP